MTVKTENLLSDITEALYEKKAVLLTGNSGVGKTFLAREVIQRLKSIQYSCFPGSSEQDVKAEIMSCHNSVTYEDIVGGISIETESGKMSFKYRDKILVEMIVKAAEDYHKRKGTKYVLFLDDMQRNDISSLFGDVLCAIGNESKITRLHLNSGVTIDVTPNFYIIGTYNGTETGASLIPNELMSRFYIREILSDIEYISDDTESENKYFYEQVRSLVLNNLDMQYKTSTYEQNRYIFGHGYFQGNNTVLRLKYQLIPTLKQYITEGVLDSGAGESVRLLEAACNKKRKKMPKKQEKNCFDAYKKGVTPAKFVDEDSTRSCSSVPIENLVGRIIDQHLLTNDLIKNNILFNRKICYREIEVGGITYQAKLIANDLQYRKIRRGGNSDGRPLYNGGTILVDGEEYHFTGGSHPKDYVKEACWSNEDGYKLGESFGGNLVLYRTVWQYYQTLIGEFSKYVSRYSSDDNKQKLLDFIRTEWKDFFKNFKNIKPKNVSKDVIGWKNTEAVYNQEANKEVRKLIGKLNVLWKNPGDTIVLDDGAEVMLEGVDSEMSDSVYKEYWDAMETLEIRQMILQGPPGTSKTYSAKAFLKYMAGNCSDSELADLQIEDYMQEKKYCAKLSKGKGKPQIAWDIVQFHPSYGYEDFIRGIKVSTDKMTSTIKYETVNKVLGNMAELAKKDCNRDTNFFLIIDEINRANLATVFGELIYGLEYRKEPVATPYSVNNDYKISLPDNLYIIGTMNTADKSIGGIDYAIRRRFLFFELLPDESVIKAYKIDNGDEQKKLNAKACRLFDNVKKVFGEEYLSPEYRKEDVQIGHTYFLVDSEDKLRREFEYQIVPILKEYFKDGIISFDADDSRNGFSGLLNCISGKINLTTQKEEVDKIFKDLIE